MWARDVLEYCKQSLMGKSRRSSEDQNVYWNVDSEDYAPEVSDGSKNSIGNWTRGYWCYIVAGNMSTFCLFPETL
jgi:hypothetical protein